MIVREFVICRCGFYGALIYLIKYNTVDIESVAGKEGEVMGNTSFSI